MSKEINNNMTDLDDVISKKLADAMTPGYQVEFDPDEAERAGAFGRRRDDRRDGR